ncbi:MAG TPA: metallophosphoesterase [Pyrinomonadaceae bacterium]|nr:metallophosphoesterase [Pyrinomonadaceae bacterium]
MCSALTANGQATPPANFKVAFMGDQSLGANPVAVLNLIKAEGAQAVLHSGDFDYADNPAAWEAQINGVLGADFPYFATIGNHDMAAWRGAGGYQQYLTNRFNRLGVTWEGDLGVQSSFHYKGIFFVLTAPGLAGFDSGASDLYIRDRLAADRSLWSISSWHTNMRLMQVGGKLDETGWGVYEESRKGGAIIATAHEHSYSRTHLLSSMSNQTVASASNTLTLTKGRSFAFVSGLGGHSVRPQLLSGDWWASISASTCLSGDPVCQPDGKPGALFGIFNVDGRPDKAFFYFKDINGRIVDSFTVISRVEIPLAISEFRLRGTGGASDEFVEIYNASDSDLTVNTDDGSAGFALVASDGAARFHIPNGTLIPARGHYLGVNSTGYSLGSYAPGDTTYTADIPDGVGLALFNTANPANFTLANRLDAVGSTTEINPLYREGDGYPESTPADSQHSFYRDQRTGLPKDTNNNADDFLTISTSGFLGATQTKLGAPAPEGLSSPVQRNAQVKSSLIDPQCGGFGTTTSACALVRTAEGANAQSAAFGTLRIRRKFTNKTGTPVTRLRFRVVDITTTPESGVADLRVLGDTGSFDVTATNSDTVTIQRLTLEQPPTQPNGGGFNSTVRAGTISLGTPLIANNSINVEFLLGVMQNGNFRFLLNVEALPAPATNPPGATRAAAMKVAVSMKHK